MSHHVSASPSNPTGAVEVVRVPSSSATTAPVDGGGAAGTGVSTPTSTTPVSTEVTGTATTPVAGQSGTPGANLPVDGIQQASTTIEGAKADLARTAGAERRLDGFDLVGGGGGGGGGEENADAGKENANNAEGAVAQATADMNVSDQEGGVGGERVMGEQELTTTADQNANQSVDTAAGQGADQGVDAATGQSADQSAAAGHGAANETDPRSTGLTEG